MLKLCFDIFRSDIILICDGYIFRDIAFDLSYDSLSDR